MSIDILDPSDSTIQVVDDANEYLIVAAETGNFLILEERNSSLVDIIEHRFDVINIEDVLFPYIDIYSSDCYAPIVDYLDVSFRDSTNPILVYGGRTEDLSLDPNIPIWQIYSLNIETLEKKYANGNENYTNIWADRESLTYA